MNLQTPAVYVICGLQGGGKSHLIRYMMSEMRDKFDCGVVFSNTGFSEGNFEYVDKRFVHLEYQPQVLKNLKDIFRKRIEAGRPLSGFVIFDDCLEGGQWKEPELRSLITQVRHYNITIIISTQYPKAIPPLFRTNTWQAFMFAMPTEDAMKAMWSNFGQMFGSYPEFKQFLLQATSTRHQFIAYNAREGPPDPRGRYQVMIAPKNIPKFTLKGPK